MSVKHLIAIAFSILLVAACEDSTGIGEDFIVKEPVNLYYMDTIETVFSTVRFDSIPTSNTSTFLVGYHEDEKLGKISASSYFQLGFEDLTRPESSALYKDIILRLYFDDYLYYDTTQLISFSVHQITEELEYSDDTYLYNSSNSFKYDTAILGSITFAPRPFQKEYVDITLDDTLGIELFQQAQDGGDIYDDVEKFRNKYKGLALIPNQNNGPIIRFSSTSQLLIQYYQSEDENELIFNTGGGIYFSQIISDRSFTSLKTLSNQKEALESTATNNEAYLQAGVGLGIRIEFPALKNLNELEGSDYLSQAFLRLGVVKGSDESSTPIPSELSVYVVDGLNRVLATYSPAIQLNIDEEFGEDTHYLLQITSFIRDQLKIEEINENALLIALPTTSFYSTVDRLYIGDKYHENKSLLELYFLNYEIN